MANKTVDIVATVEANNAGAAEKQTFKGKCVVAAELPVLPDDAATHTYGLQAVNGVLTWTLIS